MMEEIPAVIIFILKFAFNHTNSIGLPGLRLPFLLFLV